MILIFLYIFILKNIINFKIIMNNSLSLVYQYNSHYYKKKLIHHIFFLPRIIFLLSFTCKSFSLFYFLFFLLLFLVQSFKSVWVPVGFKSAFLSSCRTNNRGLKIDSMSLTISPRDSTLFVAENYDNTLKMILPIAPHLNF